MDKDRFEVAITRIGLIATGSYLLHVAHQRFWAEGEALWNWQSLALSFITYGLAFGLLGLGLLQRRPKKYEGFVLLGLIFALFAQYYVRELTLRAGWIGTTDAALFSNYAAHLQLMGNNPYSWNVSDAFSAYRISNFFMTPTLIGGAVEALNYPALHFILLIPLKAIGIEAMRAIYVAAFAGILILLFLRTPSPVRGIILLPFLVNVEYMNFTMGWGTDSIWVLLLVGMIIVWRRPTWRAILFGLACSYKQMPWLLGPFILARLLLDEEDADQSPRVQRVAYFFGLAGVVFLVINAPYMLADFRAWFTGILTPFVEPLIYLGSGLSALTQLDILQFPKGFYSLASAVVMLTLLLLYAINFRRLKHTLWFYPGVVLWFSYRSLQSYYIYWVALLIVAVIEPLREPLVAHQPASPLAAQPLLPRISLGLAHFWKQASEWLGGVIVRLQAQRRASLMAIAAALVLLGGFTVYFLQAAVPLEVELVNLTLDANVYQIRQVAIRIHNISDRTVRPRVAVQKGSWQPYAWDIESGPLSLAPGQHGKYLVSTDLPYRMFDLIDGALIVVTDASGDYRLRGTLEIQRDLSLLDPDAIFNSNYLRGPGEGAVPWGWGLDVESNGASIFVPQGEDAVSWPGVQGQEAMQSLVMRNLETVGGFQAIELGFASSAGQGEWESVGLSQWILFPTGDLLAWVRPPVASPLTPEGPALAYGLEFDDGQRRLWILFGPGSASGYVDENHYYAYQSTPPGVWSQQRVNLVDLYAQLDWPMPPLQRIVRGDIELLTRMVTVRLILAAREQPRPELLLAQFGPLRVEAGRNLIRQRVADTVAHASEYYAALGDLAVQRRNFERANIYYAVASWVATGGENTSSVLNQGSKLLPGR